METIIHAKGIGKKYTITHQQGGYVALRDVIANALTHPFSFLKRKTKQLVGIGTKEEFWALRDVDFEIKKGEVVGIIGRNGAGKSTLLKILSQITPPTTGEIRIHGTVGSLLEVGTGFHPELTGRENIFLNGAILGMKKKEIAQKFDAIVAFAGIEKFLDTPVKYYSSGMYVRLAFSVAAHMESDILIIDEVLAVGDADFQKKCMNKMEEITKRHGRTILFVSHNMSAIKDLCHKSILLENGKIRQIGKTSEVIDTYMKSKSHSHDLEHARQPTRSTILTGIEITAQNGTEIIKSNDKLNIRIAYKTGQNLPIEGARLVITIVHILTQQAVMVLDSFVSSETWGETLKPEGEILCTTDIVNLTEGEYMVHVDFLIQGTSIEYIPGMGEFRVLADLDAYDYKNSPDANTCHRMIRHSFIAK